MHWDAIKAKGTFCSQRIKSASGRFLVIPGTVSAGRQQSCIVLCVLQHVHVGMQKEELNSLN